MIGTLNAQKTDEEIRLGLVALALEHNDIDSVVQEVREGGMTRILDFIRGRNDYREKDE